MKSNTKAKFIFLFFILFILAIWQFSNTSFIVSKPLEILKEIFILLGTSYFWKNLVLSSLRVYGSIFLALFIGIVIGTLFYFNKTLGRLLELISYPTQFIASATLTILLILFFGLSNELPIFIITIIILPNVFVAVKIGMDNLRKDLIEFGSVYSKSKLEMFKRIILPQLGPYILSGIIRANAVAWKIVVTAEIFIATSGLGFMLNSYFRTLNTSRLFALAFIIMLLGLLTDKILRYKEVKVE